MLTNPQDKRSDYVRDGLDWYVEPSWCVDLLLDRLPDLSTVWDPACGAGTIPEACRARGICAVGSDIADRGYGRPDVDFLPGPGGGRAIPFGTPYAIITNPPYGKATDFIAEARRVARRIVAVLVRLDYLASQRRRALFVNHPPARVLVLSKRPSMPPGEQLASGAVQAKGGQHDFCWIVWDRRHDGPTQMEWLAPEEGVAA